METSGAYGKILFGLKVRQARTQLGLSFAELSEASGLSISYLNEIEKGKKYPKPEKVRSLARALKVPAGELASSELTGSLAPVGDLLRSNFLQELPLEFFGIEPGKVVEIIASAPREVGAFISTLVDLSRNYALREEHFYFGALRAYLEMHQNYFADLEEAADRFREQFGPWPQDAARVLPFLRQLLQAHWSYRIEQNALAAYPEFAGLRAVFLPSSRRLLLQAGLTPVQEAFQLGKELGFQYLGLEKRAQTSSLIQVHSFEEALNHFKASYFAAALLIDRKAFSTDLHHFFEQERFHGEMVGDWASKYLVSPETIVQRMSNLLTGEWGLSKLFIWRFVQHAGTGAVRIDKELNLVRDHLPSRNSLREHLCRRWSAVQLLNAVNGRHEALMDIQKVTVQQTGQTFLCLSMARPALPAADHKVSIVLGLLVDEALAGKVRFLQDPQIETRIVNQTCERCNIADCHERMAPPVFFEQREQFRKMREILEQLNQG
jgi:transcriptional regulator with XRE-family HTH domain